MDRKSRIDQLAESMKYFARGSITGYVVPTGRYIPRTRLNNNSDSRVSPADITALLGALFSGVPGALRLIHSVDGSSTVQS